MADSSAHYGRFGGHLTGVSRCPHCGIANPQLVQMWRSDHPMARSSDGFICHWGVFRCTTCGCGVMAKGHDDDHVNNAVVERIYPSIKQADDLLPPAAKTYLQQAYETIHAPDAATVMAASAVDAMLKDKGYKDGSLYDRIDKAVGDHLLTEGMGKWAHAVRLESNKPRHADDDEPHVTEEDAVKMVEFAEALGDFLYVLTARIESAIGPDE